MCFNYLWKRFVPFGLMFSLGLFAVAFLYKTNFTNVFRQESKSVPKIVSSLNNGEGSSRCCDNGDYVGDSGKKTTKVLTTKIQSVKIVSKPKADYTDEARINQIQGKVVLRVTFSATQQIGAISMISGLPDGLTEQAIAAARNIKFEPAKQNGKPISVTKLIEYTFTIY
jgi:TonB family protein